MKYSRERETTPDNIPAGGPPSGWNFIKNGTVQRVYNKPKKKNKGLYIYVFSPALYMLLCLKSKGERENF